MQMPKNYNETKAGGEFTPIELGGHHMVIKQVEETTSKTGKPMLKIFFDFAKNDSQPGYMTEEYKVQQRHRSLGRQVRRTVQEQDHRRRVRRG